MKLSTKQQIFTECVGQLIQFAYSQGYGLTFGDAYRDPRVHGEFGEKKSYSSGNSVHKYRLAVDFNLFKDGIYLTDTACYAELGEYWKSLSEHARWGGDFSKPDGNHFSFEQWGYA